MKHPRLTLALQFSIVSVVCSVLTIFAPVLFTSYGPLPELLQRLMDVMPYLTLIFSLSTCLNLVIFFRWQRKNIS